MGPRINLNAVTYQPGTAGSFDLYARIDFGELTTNGVGKSATINVSNLPAGFSYSDTTAILSWTAAANGVATIGVTATNSVGQWITGSVALFAGSVPVAGEDGITTAYVNAMAVSPPQARRQLINDLIAGLRSDGVLGKLERFALIAAHNEQAGYLDVVQPAKQFSKVGGGTYTVDRGYAGNGTASYLNLGESPTPAGAVRNQNDITIGYWINQQNGATGLLPHIAELAGSSRYLIQARGSAGSDTFRSSDGSADVLRTQSANATRIGHRTASRTGPSTKKGYFNGASTAMLSTPSSGAGQGSLTVFKNGTKYCPDRVAAVYLGSGFTDADATKMHARLSTYLTAIGAN